MRKDLDIDFEEYKVSIPCVKANGDTAIFNCDVCGRQRYWASPCTPDDCEERLNEFCAAEECREIVQGDLDW